MTSMNDAEQVDKHTPGAWVAEGSMVRGGEGIYLDDPIASVYDPNDQHHLTPTTKANARLIAAAPELLAALEQVHAAMDAMEHGRTPPGPTGPAWLAATKALIIKAKGGVA